MAHIPQELIRGKEAREMAHIPQELIRDILVRLPVKSVLRFTCVSKHWQFIIADSYFVELQQYHQKRQQQEPEIAIVAAGAKSTEFFVDTIDIKARTSEDDEGNVDGREDVIIQHEMTVLDAPVDECFKGVTYSCNGLICIFGANHIHVCNPSTQEFRTLPQGTPTFPPFHKETRTWCQHVGFGRDLITKEYKVVRIVNAGWDHVNLAMLLKQCQVLTLGPGSCSWRDIGPCVYHMVDGLSPTLVKGVLYWLADQRYHMYAYESIIAFDLHNESFSLLSHLNYNRVDHLRELEYLDYMLAYYRGNMSLINVRDFLCMVEKRYQASNMRIWILRPDSVTNSMGGKHWEALYDIELDQIAADGYLTDLIWKSIFPVVIYDNLTICLCIGSERLYTYDLRSKRVRRVAYYTPGEFLPVEYVGSLFPIFGRKAM